MSDLKEWAKLATDWYEEPDLIAAAEACPAAFPMWPVLVAKAKGQSHATRNPDGAIAITPMRLAFDARCDVSQVGPALDALAGEKLLTYSAHGDHKILITLTGFAKWQAPRGSNADKQQRKYAKKKAISADLDTTVTPTDTTVTPVRHLEGEGEGEQEGEGEGEKKETTTSPSMPKDDTDRKLFERWLTATGRNPNQNRLTKKRRGLVRARRADGYTEAQLMEAIDGIARSPWHAGENPSGTRYDTFDFIFRSGENVEKGVERSVTLANRAAAGTPAQPIRAVAPRHQVSEEYDDGIQWHTNTHGGPDDAAA